MTDPELVETFNNFAFDEALRNSSLDVPDPFDGSARGDRRLPSAARGALTSDALQAIDMGTSKITQNGDRLPEAMMKMTGL